MLVLIFRWGSRERPLLALNLSSEDRSQLLIRLGKRYQQRLDQSLQGAVHIELGLASRLPVIQAQSDQTEQPLAPIVQAYEGAGRELLLLGKPGSGKSTQLYELAQHLLEQAKQDVAQPLPIVFSLSS